MVVHFSSKLSHLAQSFRPQHHFNTIRNAFPSSGGSSTSNVFGSATSSVGSGGASQAAGSGAGGTAGGAGGAKWHAGSRAPNWGFQSHDRLVAQAQAANADSNSRLTDEEEETNQRRPGFLQARGRRARIGLQERRASISSPDRPLLSLEETGLSGVRLSTGEMQDRFRAASSKVEAVAEVEADEMDFVGPPSNVLSSGRRASVSRSMITTPTRPSASPRTAVNGARPLHVSSFPRSSPPRADVSRVRRKSTSSIEEPPARFDTVDLTQPRVPQAIKTRRPRASAPTDTVVTRSPVSVQRVDVQAKGQAMREAKASGNYLQVKEAVRRYVASDSIYVTSLHNAAMDALYATRPRDESIDEILDLYNQLFAHDSLRPDQKSYELIIRTLVQRDGEILRAITTLEKRKLKKMLAMRARGPWNIQVGDKPDTFVLANEVEEMARLKAEDYFSPALKIYQALGTNGDQLGVATINQLIKGAAKRGRTDLALSLFGRIERSPYQLPNGATYATLLQMFGEEKDAEAVMEIFEGYLAARANGLRPPVERSVPAGNAYKMTTTKHRHSASLQSAQGAPREGAPVQIYTTGDDSVWRTAITALFAAGDAVGAVALVERLQEGQAAAKLPPGYTTLKIESFGFSALVGGFLGIKDEESARRWFDRGVPGDDDHDLAERIYSGVLYTALDLEASESMVSHIYRQTLAVPNASIPIGPFVTILDYSIVTAYNGATEAERDAAFENVVFFKQSFETAVQEGRASVPDFTFSTGVLSRILSVAGSRGRFDVAASTYVELSTATVNAILADPAGDDGFRTHSQWAKGLQTMAAAAFGWSPDVSSPTPSLHYVRPAAGSPTPSLAQVVDIVGAFNKGGIAASYGRNDVFEAYVAENYVLAKAAAKGDVTALALSGNQWFTVVKSFSNVAAQMARGVQPAFEFAGFEPIIDDFVASGAQLPVADECDYQGLLMALQASGMERSRILAVVSVLDPKVCEMITNGGTPPTSLPPTPPAPTVTVDDLLTGATALDPAAALAAATPPSFPTPPPTPPAYFTELHAPPPVENRGHLNSDLTSKIGSLIYHDKLDQALALLQEKAAVGLLAHPDSIGHLVEGLGREGKRDSLQAAYLLAYASINAMNNDPHGQSISWILLEDRMIIGLAQMGALEEVAVHRDRLLQAGTAPSADGYAAMILNMKETTDDAAVALELFEESQRFNVSPNVYLFNTLISKLSRARRATDALRYFELMKETGLRPTSITYGAIINACCKTGDSPSADYLFQEMVAAPGFKPRVPPYNTMIQFYTQTQPNRERALHFYDQMRAVGVQPTGHTYKLLLDAYGSIGTPDPQSMSDVFDQLLADPLVAVTGAHWASLINAWGCAAKDLDRATAIFDSIEKHPSTIKSRAQLPDAVVFESLLNAFLANGRPDLCDRYLGEMTKRGVRMTAYVANTLIKGHASQNNMEGARTVFESLIDPPSGVAAAGNHSTDRNSKRHRPAIVSNSSGSSASSSVGGIGGEVYREPSTWEIMVRSELGAGENARAVALLRRLEGRAFPEAVVNRIRKLLHDVGLETLPTPPSNASSPPPRS